MSNLRHMRDVQADRRVLLLYANKTEADIVFLGTFSKIFCPGMRIGWLTAPGRLFEKYVLVKQGVDLHTSTLNQMQVAGYLDRYDIADLQSKAIYIPEESFPGVLEPDLNNIVLFFNGRNIPEPVE